MLLEAIKHFFLSAPKPIKELGFGKEAIAINTRYKRCQTQWGQHLEATKSELINIITNFGTNKNVVIMGSGSLLDIPLSELSKHTKSLTLIDIIQLKKIKKIVLKFPNVKIVERDLTDYISPFISWTEGPSYFSPPKIPTPNFSNTNANLIISLNLISQLSIPFLNYVVKHKMEKLPDSFEQDIINAHLSALQNSGADSWVIGDISRDYMEDGKVIKTEFLPENLKLPKPVKSWNWDIAPRGEVDLNISICHKVGVWDLS